MSEALSEMPAVWENKPTPPRWRQIWSNRWLLFMVLPAFLVQLAFAYVPMAGMSLAFRDVNTFTIPWGSRWVGFENFVFLNDDYFWATVRNTLVIAAGKFLVGFPAPIILALLLNEVKNAGFKRIVQTVSYLPHFIAWAVIANIIDRLFSTDMGMVNDLIRALGGKPIHFTGDLFWFLPLVLSSHVWKEIGFSSIVYLASITQINPELYEAARVDGAGRWGQLRHVTWPGVIPMVSMMLVLSIPNLVNAGFDQIYLLGNPMNQPVSEIVDTYVIRQGLSYGNYSFATAVGLFNSVIALILLLIANNGSRKLGGSSIW